MIDHARLLQLTKENIEMVNQIEAIRSIEAHEDLNVSITKSDGYTHGIIVKLDEISKELIAGLVNEIENKIRANVDEINEVSVK